jgi:AcrR family transcriptional regulator
MMAVMALEKPTGTRERILAEAAELFAVRGYGATSTRDIAEAVGIRQPSLFHHFASKAAILTELLDRSLDDAVPLARRSAKAKGPVGRRLFDYLVADFAMVLTSPWNLSGVYSDEVLRDPEFATQAAQIDELDAAIRTMIRQGVAGGEFVKVDAELTQAMIAGLEIGLIQSRPKMAREDPARACREAASFVLRSLLVDPAPVVVWAQP